MSLERRGMEGTLVIPAYAAKTRVPVERSRSELERLLTKHGADQFLSFSDVTEARAAIAFRLKSVRYKIEVPLPPRPKEPTTYNLQRWDQACRARWRVVLLLVRTKLELVAIGASTIEREFLADTVMSNGKTVGETFPHIMQAALSGSAETLHRLLSP